ncbi:MAG TPA: ATP-binding protein [bacterium]|nr:ATP-binding protein [bacterium]
MIYKRKIIDEILTFINLEEIIVLHGARQVGKTHILLWLQNYLKDKKENTYFIDLEDSRFKKILDLGIDEFINHLKEEGFYPKDEKKLYVFIDEIQYLENPSNFLKLIADHYKNIKLIISGSSSFEIKNKFKDSLVGRTINFEIFNLSFEEFLLFKGYNYNQKQVFTQKKNEELKMLYKEFVLFGAYPKIALIDEIKIKEKRLQQIIDTYIKKDIKELANIDNIEKFNKLIEILASQSGQIINVKELSDTCDLSVPTIEKYLFILEQTYIIKLVKPYNKNIRSELVKAPKVFFYDSGLMQMLIFKSLTKEIIGNVFETNIFSELIKKYKSSNIYYWRTKDKKEIDFIIKDKNNIIPVEVKLNFARADYSTINYFLREYNLDKNFIIALDGNKDKKTCIYPWEI